MPQTPTPLRAVTLLSPLLFETYAAITQHLGAAVGRTATLETLMSFDALCVGHWDIAFVCGAHYVQLTHRASNAAQVLAAPVLIGRRYQQKPWYFSDVVVRAQSSYHTWEDLAGCVWGINERGSHSGYQVVEHYAHAHGHGWQHFGHIVETGAHLRSLEMVLEGTIDATAIDSHLFDVYRQRHRAAAQQLRTLTMIGPSTIPPILVGGQVPARLVAELQVAAHTMHHDAAQARRLRQGRIAHLSLQTPDNYADIRQMWSARLAGSS